MHRKIRFRQGDRVNGISLSGKSILGVYRGVRASFGVYVYGLEVGGSTVPDMHICQALTLKKIPSIVNKKGRLKTRPAPGNTYSGRTKNGDLITGLYMNSDGDKVWIRGWKEGEDRTLPKQAYKVLTNTLQKL